MLFFGPRLPCPRCGRKSGKPRNADHYLCPHCHEPGPWASPEQVAEWTDMTAARKEFEALLARVAAGEAPPAAGTVGALTARAHYRPGEPQEMAFEALDRRVETALADHQLGAEEERTLAALAPALGVGWETYAGMRPGLEDRLTIARANAGRLIALASTRLMTQGGEVVYAEVPAAILKEVAKREYRAGYSGVSIPIGHTRARIHVGGARGHSVIVGTEQVAADTGTLVLSSQRAVFLGALDTLELLYSKLVNVEVFADGVRLHVTNRKSAPLFRVPNGEVVAAIVNAAAHPGT